MSPGEGALEVCVVTLGAGYQDAAQAQLSGAGGGAWREQWISRRLTRLMCHRRDPVWCGCWWTATVACKDEHNEVRVVSGPPEPIETWVPDVPRTGIPMRQVVALATAVSFVVHGLLGLLRGGLPW